MDQNKQVEVSHYNFKEYMHKRRWNSLYHQIDEIILSEPNTILEIGVGSNILKNIVENIGYSYESLDSDSDLNPSYVGSVLKLPFPNQSYDTIACYQVLEHLPYSQFETALSELFRVSKKAVLISLPDVGVVYPLHIYKICVRKFISRPFRKQEHNFDGEHYWEINKKGYETKKIKRTIENIAKQYSFSLEKDYRVWENPYHHFFILKKN